MSFLENRIDNHLEYLLEKISEEIVKNKEVIEMISDKKIQRHRKIFLLMDRKLYKNLFDFYAIKNEDGSIISSEISVDYHFINLITNKEKINYLLNITSGINNVTHLIIQKNLFTNIELLILLERLKKLSPATKIIVYFEENFDKYELLLHYILTNDLAVFINREEELLDAVNGNLEIKKEQFLLEKITKKHKKEFKKR